MWTADNKGMAAAGVVPYNRVIKFIPLAVSTPGARASRRKFGCPLFLGVTQGGV